MQIIQKFSGALVGVLLLAGCTADRGPVPADPLATRETVNLYQNLLALQKEGLMFGHQDDLVYGVGWVYEVGRSDVKEVCGDYPAVYGWELGHLELGEPYSLDSVHFDTIRSKIQEVYRRGGVNTVSWHLRNPLTGGSAWDVSSAEAVKSVLPGGGKHDLYLGYLDKLAGFLLSLKSGDGTFIPVIFRPYHEHTGSWFWWGQKLCNTDEFIALWRFTFDYLCNEKNIHNLLFAYSSGGDIENTEQYLERYPGNDYVDLMGFDYYQMPDAGNSSFTENVSRVLEIVTEAASGQGKLAALTEAGYEGIPDSAWWTTALWPAIKDHRISYALVWRNAHNRPGHFYAPHPDHVSAADFISFRNLPETLFQKDITALDIYNRE